MNHAKKGNYMKNITDIKKEDKVILSAYLGILMCEAEELINYLSKVFNRKVDAGEFTEPNFFKDVREKVKSDFDKLLIDMESEVS